MIVFDTQVAAQQYLLREIPRGYWFWTSGIASNTEKLNQLSDKFKELYGTTLPKDKRYFRKRKGLANAKAIAVQMPDGDFLWVLLVTEGKGVVMDHEKNTLQDARTSAGRVVWWGDYVLNQVRRPKEHGGGLHWTWFLTPTKESEISRYMTALVKNAPKAPHELRHYVDLQLRRPMHSGIRSQLTRILKSAHKLFVRCYHDMAWPSEYPTVPLPILAGFRKATKDS